ncbi:pyridoxine/pyridoxamine 5'-phosphate oxidase 2-like isoform X2 [Chenopodium quinoa]|uniref:pyridoxine/pyridoxamine 5'-phosphate oxidase 2-like isoform X2 n=1 Tax=Chenopodium quinoa TaxID=63459 RepID=UPI000B77757D|nr:pyridoxine/pyridoxamine 5'-phosphate oxidase 2-like isoform X2 [Chenopodium quinoa]
MQEMNTATPWKQLLLHALEANSHLKHSLFFQLASVGANGKPANRTVVFRGFQDETDKIQINTDCRTRKIEDLKHCPFAEQREKSWFASSFKSRLQYLGPDPGIPSITEELPKDFSLDPSAGPVDAFCLLVLDPDQVDYLNLKTNTRLTYRCHRNLNGEKCWTPERINP